MIQSQYSIVDIKKDGIFSIPQFSKFPDELEGFWIHITKNLNRDAVHVASFYLNNEYPSGTVLVSDKIRDEYPDIYLSFNEKHQLDKTYINPKLRKKGYLLATFYVLRTTFYQYLNCIMDGTNDRSDAVQKGYLIFKEYLNEFVIENQKSSKYTMKDIELPRDSMYPEIWYNQRVGGKNV